MRWELLFQLIIGHAFADFVFQSNWMAQHKHPWRPIDLATVPPGQKPQCVWPYVLVAHGLTHGAMVYLITQNPLLGAAETVLHSLIDAGKCANRYGIHVDQGLHLLCKLAWVWWR